MKTPKLLGTTMLLCLFVVACAKSTKEEAALIAKDTANQEVSVADREVMDLKVDLTKESYSGDNLKMTTKDPKNHGVIQLTGVDAKELYSRMTIKSIEDNPRDSYTSRSKKGRNLVCYEYAKLTEHKEITHACYIDFDYLAGTVLVNNEKVEIDDSVNVNTEAFTEGKMLSIVASEKNAGKIATITLASKDSKALYTTLNVEPSRSVLTLDTGTTFVNPEKIGANVRCLESIYTEQNITDYSCTLTIDPTTGQVNAAKQD